MSHAASALRPLDGPLMGHQNRLGLADGRGWRWFDVVLLLLAAVVLASLHPTARGQRIHSVAGPFRVIPDHTEHCPPSVFQKGEQAFWHFRAFRDRHNFDIWYYYGNFTTLFVFSDSQHVEMNMASWSSRGGWKPNAVVLKFRRMCTTGQTYLPTLWHNVASHVVNEKNQSQYNCPYPTGTYFLQNATADLSIARKVPAFFYGKWRMDFHIVNEAWETISCMRIFLRTVPITAHGSRFGANNQNDTKLP